MDKLEIYNKARSVPNEAKRTISSGRLRGFTDINPMWRIKRLTELFGSCGVGWWYEIAEKRIIDDETTKQKVAFVDILLYYVDPESGKTSHGIPGTGGATFLAQESKGAYLSDECFKMALTDAISVAAKALGIGADVYYEKDKDSKYAAANETSAICSDCGKTITSYHDAKGKPVSSARLIKATTEKFGRALCRECAEKAGESE